MEKLCYVWETGMATLFSGHYEKQTIGDVIGVPLCVIGVPLYC